MFGIRDYGAFLAAIAIFQAAPGPGTVAILDATARHGVRAGMAAVLGTLAGDALFMVGAVVGLAGVLRAHPAIFAALQWAGVVYLGWLGARFWFPVKTSNRREPAREEPWSGFRTAFLVCLSNPKAILFFVAFFPVFLSREPSASTLAAMMVHVTGLSLVYQTGLVLGGRAVAIGLARVPHFPLLARMVAGAALIGIAARMAWRLA